MVVNDWRISILTVLTRSCSLTSPLWYRFVVVLFDRRHPPFWNFNSTIPIDIVRAKANVIGFFTSNTLSGGHFETWGYVTLAPVSYLSFML